ncbi:MAG: ABC transporter substrate-binding protein [Alphaproteobacteria bacterium]|nr:ABC transporter substrate-binding protein [Alphaproteobacteria bacterium]
MTHPIKALLGVTAIAAAIAAGASGALAQSAGKTLKFIPQADLRILDPIFTTAYITRNHGYMVYDTLLAVDEKFNVKPQMAEGWSVSADKLTYTFTLRDGLKFHDGQPVRPADVIASIKRWGARDVIGQTLIERTAAMEAVDAKTFKIVLKQPFALTLEALSKPSSNTPFIMPERIANTNPNEQIKDATGSGPFKFVANEWVPGNKVVYVKNTDYVPRKEPPSWASGGKVAKVDRVEWLYIPDTATAAAAIDKGEVDWWEQVPVDLVPLLNKNKDIKVENIDPLGSLGMIRFNHTLPPFDNVKMRQALLHVVDQNDYMLAIAGDAKNGKICASYFTCGTPMASDVGTQVLLGKRDMDKAKALIKEAGYKGEKIVILSATDQPIVHAQGLLTTELLRKLGLNVELAASDWGTLITRRSSKEPLERGGWSIFHTWWVGPDLATPAQNAAIRGHGGPAWFGWPTDPEMEKLRNAWFDAPDLDTQKKVAAQMQARAFESVPYIPTAQFILPTAFRKNVEGIIVAPVAFLWNVEKK